MTGRPAFTGSRWFYVLASLLALAPCYWQQHVQAGDLSSHIYNAWLAQLIESGHGQGLVIAGQTTNILFDLMLSGIFKIGGAELSQRISVSVAVLVFVWGAFAFVSAVSGRRPWHLLPCIAMLAYGWVFHMGFFNFYLSLGLCFWALALSWKPARLRIAMAGVLLALAYSAHALPVLWTVCVMAYVWIARRLSSNARTLVITGCLAAVVVLQAIASQALVTRWSPHQIALSTGADQAWVFDSKYSLAIAGVLLVWGLLFLDTVHRTGWREIVFSIPFQICASSAMAVFILPDAVLIPGSGHGLVYIAERMSLPVGISVCAWLGAAQPTAFARAAMLLVAFVFFGFLYRDERALNRFEDRMQDAVAQLSPGQRVVSGVDDPDLRVNALTHMIDRVCVGRCFSYANYEPSTALFRIRVMGKSPIVTADYGDSFQMQRGTYVLKDRDLPLYKLDLENGRMVIRSLKAGLPCGSTFWKALPNLLSKS